MPMYMGYGYGLPKAVKYLLVTNVIVFLLTELLLGPGTRHFFFQLFGLTPILVSQRFMIWQFFTHMFLHGGLGHIFFNMFALWMFGAELEYNWGTRDFIKYYFFCGIGGGILVWLTSFVGLSNPMVPTIGASGAIFGLLVAYGMMWPDRMIFLFGILPMKAIHFVLIFGTLDLFYGLSGTRGGIAYFAHVGGGITGFLYLKFGWRIAVHFEHFTSKMKRRKFKVVQGGRKDSSQNDSVSHPDYDAEVDRILDKIAREGMDSLTDRERRILDRASNRKR